MTAETQTKKAVFGCSDAVAHYVRDDACAIMANIRDLLSEVCNIKWVVQDEVLTTGMNNESFPVIEISLTLQGSKLLEQE